MPSVTCTCQTCGATFTYDHCRGRRRRYCTDECRRQLRWRQSTERLCEQCGLALPSGCHGKRRFCSQKCQTRRYRANQPEAVREHVRTQERIRRASLGPRSKSPRVPAPVCATCGLPKHRNAMANCSRTPACRSAARLERTTRCRLCEKPAQGRGLCSTHYQQWWAEQNPDRRRAQKHKARARRKAIEATAFVEYVSPERVFELDRWVCHLCRKRIPKGKRSPHPLSATVDHVIPLSKGGLHVYENCRAAHFGCNSAKSDRGGGEQLLLIVPRTA